MNKIKKLSEVIEKTSYDCLAHFSALRDLAAKCPTVVEIGLYHMGSAFPLLQGLSENKSPNRSFLGIDYGVPPKDLLEHARDLAEEAGISFRFVMANDLDITLTPIDLLHIDSYHTYRHLTYELETFSPVVSQYIVMHDTSLPWGYSDENGGYVSPRQDAKYPAHIVNGEKKGLWAAIENFLAKHPEWQLFERNETYAGFTILKRS